MDLLRRVITLEKRSESDRPYAFMIWREADGESEQEALDRYKQENGHDFPSYGTVLRITRAIKPNEDEV